MDTLLTTPKSGHDTTPTPRIGLALGGGGARGIAHIPVLEALDELGIKPAIIAGTSIGAIMGAHYAAGMSGRDIRHHTLDVMKNAGSVVNRLWSLRDRGLRQLLSGGGLLGLHINPEHVLELFMPDVLPASFGELSTPLTLVATDFYAMDEVVLDDGPLKPAIAASIAIPALFEPVLLRERVLVDGGLVNPLPYDLVRPACDLIVAVDVVGGPEPGQSTHKPKAMQAIIGSTQILMKSILDAKLNHGRQPDLLVEPDINQFRVLDFLKSADILAANAHLKDRIKRRLAALLDADTI